MFVVEVLDVLTRYNLDMLCFVFPFIVFLANVLRLRTSAGISQRFVAFSATGAALLFITSRSWSVLAVYFLQFLVSVLLFFAVRFKYHLTGERFRDPRASALVLPVAIVMSLPAFWDAGLRQFVAYLGGWLEVLALVCQVVVTKRSRRVTMMNGYLAFIVVPLLLRSITMMRRAFVESGSQMWMHWLNGVVVLLMTIDLSYFVANAKIRNEDFDLPSGLDF